MKATDTSNPGSKLNDQVRPSEVSHDDAMKTLDAMTRNVESGLFPTTGGAVSLMSKSDVDLLFDASANHSGRFWPLVLDTGRLARRSRSEWYAAAIEQALFHGARPYDPNATAIMDLTLREYDDSGVDWTRVQAYADALYTGLPRADDREYWADDGTPLTVLAFRGRPRSSAGYAARLTRHPSNRRRSRWITVSVGAAAAIIATLLVANATALHWSKVDVPAQAETFRRELVPTGKYNVRGSEESACWVGQDWSECINEAVGQYQQACMPGDLSAFLSETICIHYKTMIDDMKSQDSPGAVVAAGGSPGLLVRTPEEQYANVSNNDAQPAVTHQAVCWLFTEESG